MASEDPSPQLNDVILQVTAGVTDSALTALGIFVCYKDFQNWLTGNHAIESFTVPGLGKTLTLDELHTAYRWAHYPTIGHFMRSLRIDTGDTVQHDKSKEVWIVAYAQNNDVCPIGWPESFGRLSDCKLVKKATQMARVGWLHKMAAIRSSAGDSRQRYGATVLKQEGL